HHIYERLIFLHLVADIDVPRDDLGFGNPFADIRQLEDVVAQRSSSSALHRPADPFSDPLRSREVVPLESIGIRGVPAGHTQDWRLEMMEAALLHERRKLGAIAAGAGRLMHDDAAAGLPDRSLDRVDIKRPKRAKIDHFAVHLRFACCGERDMDHGAVSENREVAAFAYDRCLAERDAIML